jgi:ribose transport system permease protein
MSVNPEIVVSGRERQESSFETWSGRFSRLAPLWTLLALVLFFRIMSESFLRPINLNNILVQSSTLAILAVGMTFVLLTGEIDLSLAAVMTLTGMIAAQLYTNIGIPEPWAALLALGAATVLGFLNGFISVRFRIPTFMTTLAMSMIAEGLNQWISQGATIFKLSELANAMGSGRLVAGGIRILIVMAVVILLIAFFLLRYTRFGRYVYMTGASKSAARLAGVNTDLIIIACLTICGLLAGLAGIANTGRLGSALPTSTSSSYLIEAIAAVVLGGTALTGGRGGVLQTAVGVLIYHTLRNGLDNVASIDNFMKVFITGLVLLGALIINVVFSGKAERDRTNT